MPDVVFPFLVRLYLGTNLQRSEWDYRFGLVLDILSILCENNLLISILNCTNVSTWY
jgi:hypothetical protein